MYSGSPRQLLEIQGNEHEPQVAYENKLQTYLKEIQGCRLQLKLFLHRKLLRIQNLIAENEIIGR